MKYNCPKYIRIRYESKRNQPDTTLHSIQKFRSSTTGAHYQVVLDLAGGTYKVINVSQRRTIKSGGKEGFTSHWIKILAKRALESLGVVFNMGLRNIDRKPKKEETEQVSDCNLEINN